MKALVVEPSILYRKIVKMQLTELGYEVVFTKTGQESIETLNADTFDVVIFAMFLPDMNGATFCLKIRSERKLQHIPAFMVTSSNDSDVLEKASSSGVTEIFHKDDFNRFADYLRTFTDKIEGEKKISGRILYVEDNLVVATITGRVLENLGLDVDHFMQAEEALEAFKENNYDLVITDVMLKDGMSGIGFTKVLREMEKDESAIPILALTGLDDVARRIELFRAGVNDYVSKPVVDEELIARVRNLISNKKLLDKVKQQQEQLLQMAMTDPLTKLNNRHYLMGITPQKISEAFRHKTPLSMIVIDLDKFKDVNDTYGHAAGDTVLREVGRLLVKESRTEDITVRFGGEEFLIVLSHCNEAHAITKAETLRKLFVELDPGGLHISGSFGVACLPMDFKSDFTGLFAAADEAVYKAKESGRNCVKVSQVKKNSETEPS